ncbi:MULTISPECIES: PucR family transcriptional regulator [Prauserella salsuginis group]|uniref:PucR family transcriptional regulator n=1 Tax=Prauserella salsuginis TaxID=387889 RepID=A0ABW6G0N3_9PSEU|nr:MULTISPECIES: PucR family transcriptional regulator [Prauserella salsuginis group]MCR3721926.1 DNA-binding transcriptional regulator, PucR family [Prauserella flava]MCR3735932.1 DNA-binding transcriptional regulator, PucR family [Prauserella salsuginis]
MDAHKRRDDAPAPDGHFRLVDLLAEQQLGLKLVTDGDPDTPIYGAHPIEIENPSRWMKPGWLMLTTGARFGGPVSTADQQRDLVRELHSSGMAALGFGIGLSMDTVPTALLDEAHRCDFPVLSVPLQTPFLEIIDVVNRATLTKDVYLLRRTISIQDYLLESLAEQDAPAALVHRLAELLRGTVVLYDQSGTVVASSGVGPTQIIRAEIAGNPTQRRRFTIGRWHVVADPIRTDTVLHWLAVASRRRSVSEDLAEPALEAARRLIAMIVRSRESVAVESRLRRAELIRLVVAGKPSDTQYIWDRLEMHRFPRGGEMRLLALTDTSWDHSDDERLSDVERLEQAAPMERAALDTDVRLLLGGHASQIVGLVEADEAALHQWLDALPDTVHCGMSEPFTDLTVGPGRLREAELALASALRGGRPVLRFEQIGLVDWLVAGQDAASVREKARRILAPIAENEALMEAINAYFNCDCDMQRTARKLALHPNSVRYRLKRAGTAIGYDLRSLTDLAELSLTIRLLRK